MIKYTEIFNWKLIYEYPFTYKINSFFIMWWNNINIMREKDFNILLDYLKKTGVKNIDICNKWLLESFDLESLNYNIYREKYIWKWDNNIFWWKNQWISLSEEFFWLVWWDKNFTDFMIKRIWLKELIERFENFSSEWNSHKKWNWSSNLANRKNCIDLFKININ